MDSCDVLVVGGGPAGLLAAATVAAGGYSVRLVEREAEIGRPVHTSGATAPATLVRYGIPDSLHHPIHRLRFRGPTREVAFDYETTVMSIIDVEGTYKFLASRARAAGAVIETSTRATEARLSGDRVIGCTIERPDGTSEGVDSRVVVDASGYRAAISKSAGLHPGFERFGVGGEYELVAPYCNQREAVLVVGSRYAPAGYAWVFPWGQDRVRIGVGVHHGDVRVNPRQHLDVLISDAAQIGVDLRDSEIVEYHFGLVPADGLAPRLAADGIVAVGDAACQATLVVGEGIRISMDAGRLAGAAIANALRDGTADAQALGAYEARFRREFGRNLQLSHVVNRRLAAFDDAEWDDKLDVLEQLPATTVPALLQAEFSLAQLLWVVVRQPRLLGTALRYGARGMRARFAAALPI